MVPTRTPEQNRGKVDSLGSFLFQHGGWGANLLEVGYEARGGVGIREHLTLLDYLWASGLRMCGVGVSDTHGGRLLPTTVLGTDEAANFVTWIGGVTRGAPTTDVLQALRRCDVSFGNPFFVNGGLWLRLMTDTTGQQMLDMDAKGVSPSAKFYIFEAIIDSTGTGHEPQYRQYGASVLGTQRPWVGGCERGFARVEAWASNRPIGFSNVVEVAARPANCVADTLTLAAPRQH